MILGAVWLVGVVLVMLLVVVVVVVLFWAVLSLGSDFGFGSGFGLGSGLRLKRISFRRCEGTHAGRRGGSWRAATVPGLPVWRSGGLR